MAVIGKASEGTPPLWDEADEGSTGEEQAAVDGAAHNKFSH